MASEVDEADGAGAPGAAAVGCCGGCCDEAEVTLLAALEVPLVAAGAETPLGVRVVELLWLLACWLMEVLLLERRVDPTSLRKREFMDDDIQKVAFLAEQATRKVRGRAEWGVVRAERRRVEGTLEGVQLLQAEIGLVRLAAQTEAGQAGAATRQHRAVVAGAAAICVDRAAVRGGGAKGGEQLAIDPAA